MNESFNSDSRRARLVRTGLRIGAHYSPGGKYLTQAMQQALDAPATALQLFAGNPKRYFASHTSDEDRETFLAGTEDMYVIVHSVYPTNLGCSQDDRGHSMTIHSLVNQLEWAELHGATALVFHPGSALDAPKEEGLENCEHGLRTVLARYQGPVKLCLENSAGDKRNRKIGNHIGELSHLCRTIQDERLRIVIDTTHAFAAGMDIPQIIQECGLIGELLECVHFNTPDPQVTLGSFLDRHSSAFEDGAFTFDQLSFLYESLRNWPLILEGTPDLAADLTWLLSWELELRNTGEIRRTSASISAKIQEDMFS